MTTEMPTKPGIRPSEIALIVTVVIAIFALIVPYAVAERGRATRAVARTDARAVTIEVEAVLRQLGSWNSPRVRLNWDPDTRTLTIPNPGGLPRIISRQLTLSEGTRLYRDPDQPQLNVIVDRHHYCVGVTHGRAVAYQNQDGPAPSCR